MKKIFIMLLLVTWLYGCQKETDEMKLGEIYVIEDQIQVELIKTSAVTEVTPSNKNIYNQDIKAKENHVFIDCLVKVTNLSLTQKSFLNSYQENIKLTIYPMIYK